MNGTAPGLRFPPGSWSCSFATSRWSGSSFFTLADFVTLINPISGPGYDLPQPVLLASLAFSRRPGCQRKRAEFCTVFGRIRKTAPQAHVGPVVAATAEPDPAPPPRGLKPPGLCGGCSCESILRARPRPTSEGIETNRQHVRGEAVTQRVRRARPRPTSEGIETKQEGVEQGLPDGSARPRPTSEGIETKQEGVEQGLPDGPARPRPTSEGIETQIQPR